MVCKKPDVGKTFSVEAPQTSDEFDLPELGLQWQWPANASDKWYSLAARPGWLRLPALPPAGKGSNLWLAPNLPLQKFPAPEFAVTTRLDFSRLAEGDRAGLLVTGLNYSCLAVQRKRGGFQVEKTVCQEAESGSPETEEGVAPCAGGSVLLRVAAGPGALCRFSYSADGREFVELGEPFAAREGKWIGAKVGLFCLTAKPGNVSSWADFDFFRFSSPSTPENNTPKTAGNSQFKH
jgi:beta-xylosidase